MDVTQVQRIGFSEKLIIKPKKIVIALMSAAILAVFLDDGMSVWLGPFIAISMAYLYFFGHPELVTAIIILANDALGTIIAGSLSFTYLLAAFAVVRILFSKKIYLENIIFVVISPVFLLQMYFAKLISMRLVLYSVIFLLGIIVLPRDETSLKKLFSGIALSMVLIALHACITGGVEFYELNEYSEEVLRKGILGIGTADSNVSSYLLITGIVCIWCEKAMPLFWKIVCTGILLYSMLITLSVTGLLALILVTVVLAFLGEKKKKTIFALLIVIAVIALLVPVYMELPSRMHNEVLDGYIARIEEKFLQFQTGDIASATTGRSDLAADYMKYLFEQSWYRVLFGGNKMNALGGMAPHNTYIGTMLQVGVLGGFLMFSWMGWRLLRAFMLPKENENRKTVLLLKVLSLFILATLSLHQGNTWCLWYYVLLVL